MLLAGSFSITTCADWEVKGAEPVEPVAEPKGDVLFRILFGLEDEEITLPVVVALTGGEVGSGTILTDASFMGSS